MNKMLCCRRSFLALVAILCLTSLGFYHGQDISGIAVAISGIVGAVGASNAWEKRGQSKSQS